MKNWWYNSKNTVLQINLDNGEKRISAIFTPWTQLAFEGYKHWKYCSEVLITHNVTHSAIQVMINPVLSQKNNVLIDSFQYIAVVNNFFTE